MSRSAPAIHGRIRATQQATALPAIRFRTRALVAVGAGAFNALNSGVVAGIRFHADLSVPVWGAGGIMFNALPSSILPAALMSVLGSLAARRHLSQLSWPLPAPGSWIRRLPTSLIARAFVLTACTTLVVVTVTYLAITLTHTHRLAFPATMISQLIQAFVMGLILGPVIIARVLCEPQFS